MLAAASWILAVLTLDRVGIRYADTAFVLLSIAGVLFLIAAEWLGRVVVLAGLALTAVPPGEMEWVRWLVVIFAAVGMLIEVAYALGSVRPIGGSRVREPAHTLGDGEEHAAAEWRGTLAATFLPSAIGALITGIVVLVVDDDRPGAVATAVIVLGALVPAALVKIADRFAWSRRLLVPLLGVLGMVHSRLDREKVAAGEAAVAGKTSAVATGAGTAAVVVVGGVALVASLPWGSTLTGRWATSEFALRGTPINVVVDGNSPPENWTITSSGRCRRANCALAVASDEEDDFVLRRRGPSWVGVRPTLGNCVEHTKRRRLVMRDGYNVKQTIRVTPLFDVGESETDKAEEAQILLSERWVAKPRALKKDCDRTGSTRYFATAVRRSDR